MISLFCEMVPSIVICSECILMMSSDSDVSWCHQFMCILVSSVYVSWCHRFMCVLMSSGVCWCWIRQDVIRQ